jgi:hypothetical protein
MEHWEIFRSPSACATLVQAGGARPLTDGHGFDLQFDHDHGTHPLPGINPLPLRRPCWEVSLRVVR